MNQTTLALAGLGMFFTGLHLLAASMQPLVGRRMRAALSRIASGPASRAAAGSVLGAVTQSTTAAAFVCLGMLNSGALPFHGILSLLAWSSVGTSLLVFMAAVDVRLTGLYVVGLVGVAHLFNAGRHVTMRQITAFLFSLGVLLLGLGMIKDVSLGLRESDWAREFVEFAAEARIIGFLIGVIVTLITQSSASVTILAVTLHVAGVLPFGDAVVVVVGSSVGSGLSVVLATSHLDGRQRQLAIYQCLVKIVGVLVLLPLFLILDVPAFAAPLAAAVGGIPAGTRISLVYLMLQIAGALVASLTQTKLMALLDWISPPGDAEGLLKPCYIYAEAAEDADTAVVLAAREQDRLLAALPDFLDAIRDESGDQRAPIPLAVRHSAALALAAHIREFMEDTALHNRSGAAIEDIFAIQARNETIVSLLDSLNSFALTLQPLGRASPGWMTSMVEGLHLILLVMQDALADATDNRDTLLALTSDRSALMDEIRESVLTRDTGDLAERQSLFISTGIFERILWLIRQVVTSRLSVQAVATGAV